MRKMERLFSDGSLVKYWDSVVGREKRAWCDDRLRGDPGRNRPDLPDFAHFAPSHILSQCGILYLNSYPFAMVPAA